MESHYVEDPHQIGGYIVLHIMAATEMKTARPINGAK